MQNITVQELKQRKDAGETLFILDVREPSEYAETNMGALLIPLGKVVNAQIDEIEDWKDKEVIVPKWCKKFECMYGARTNGVYKYQKPGRWNNSLECFECIMGFALYSHRLPKRKSA